MTRTFLLPVMLGVTLSLGTAFAAEPAAAAAQAAKNILPDDADAAWKALVDATRPPLPPAEWNQQKPTDAELAAFRKKMGEAAGAAADKAKEFQVRFKDHKQAEQAKAIQREMLSSAVQLGADNRREELAALGGEPEGNGAPGAAPAAGPFEQKMQAAVAKARKLQDQGMDAVLDDFEKSVRELQKEFPQRPEIFGSLMEIAQLRGGEKAKAVAEEIIASTDAPKELKEMAKALKQKFDRIGKPFELKFKAIDGREVDLAALKGKVVLVDFWATWCGPCVAEIPNVVAAYEKLNPKGFEIVGISFDDDEDKLKDFVKRKKMPWVQFFDGQGWQNKYAKEFGITGIPSMWLVDKKGNLRDLEARANLTEKVEKLLAEN